MILMIDNYDSFTYNLVQYLGELGAKLKVYRNDKITISEIESLKPSHIVISPGPGVPAKAGITEEVIKAFAGKLPILGVCLGHQAIGEVFGGKIVRAKILMHGKTSDILHDRQTIFKGLPSPFTATRYHSLIVQKSSLPTCLEITAKTDKGEIMGLRHKKYTVEGVQFHPESILTTNGKKLLKNFLKIASGTRK
ncbi:anthranilate synthase component II [Candidatus Margulisiibacteriota bacterium]